MLKDEVIGQCPRCRGNLTNGHKCPTVMTLPQIEDEVKRLNELAFWRTHPSKYKNALAQIAILRLIAEQAVGLLRDVVHSRCIDGELDDDIRAFLARDDVKGMP